jgi:hypothetical protein
MNRNPVFSGAQWADLHFSHSKDVAVQWPDGHSTQGIEKHIEDLAAMRPVDLIIGRGDWQTLGVC